MSAALAVAGEARRAGDGQLVLRPAIADGLDAEFLAEIGRIRPGRCWRPRRGTGCCGTAPSPGRHQARDARLPDAGGR